MKFYCLKQSLSCPVNLIGRPDCRNCEEFGKCENCARINSVICDKCELKKEPEEVKRMCEYNSNLICIDADKYCTECINFVETLLDGLT